MRLRLPAVDFPRSDGELAARRASLGGARVAFVDGWGRKLPDGSTGMYPTMQELARLLRERESVAGVSWLHKESISRPESPEAIAQLRRDFDVVINGEGL
jgi:hypothetical protein